MLKLLVLGLAGGLGTLARYALSTALRSPLGTLAVNLLGCLLMGAVMHLLRPQPSLLAITNVAANVVLGTGAVWVGTMLARMG